MLSDFLRGIGESQVLQSYRAPAGLIDPFQPVSPDLQGALGIRNIRGSPLLEVLPRHESKMFRNVIEGKIGARLLQWPEPIVLPLHPFSVKQGKANPMADHHSLLAIGS